MPMDTDAIALAPCTPIARSNGARPEPKEYRHVASLRTSLRRETCSCHGRLISINCSRESARSRRAHRRAATSWTVCGTCAIRQARRLAQTYDDLRGDARYAPAIAFSLKRPVWVAGLRSAGSATRPRLASAEARLARRRDARERQIELVLSVGADLDRIVRYAWIGSALHLWHAPARAIGFGVLHEFLDRGPQAVEPRNTLSRMETKMSAHPAVCNRRVSSMLCVRRVRSSGSRI